MISYLCYYIVMLHLHKTLDELGDDLEIKMKDCPVEMIPAIMSCQNIVSEALDYNLHTTEEEKLCLFIRDKLIKWCYDNGVMY